MKKILVCGSRKRIDGYNMIVNMALDLCVEKDDEIIEGCCKGSADEYAEEYANKNNIKISHFPAGAGGYLKRNIEMVESCDEVVAFYDGYSYGTAHTIANAIMRNKPVRVIKI